MKAFLASSRKSLSALVGGGLAWASVALSGTHITHDQWISLAVIVATALGVYVAPNDPKPPAA